MDFLCRKKSQKLVLKYRAVTLRDNFTVKPHNAYYWS